MTTKEVPDPLGLDMDGCKLPRRDWKINLGLLEAQSYLWYFPNILNLLTHLPLECVSEIGWQVQFSKSDEVHFL